MLWGVLDLLIVCRDQKEVIFKLKNFMFLNMQIQQFEWHIMACRPYTYKLDKLFRQVIKSFLLVDISDLVFDPRNLCTSVCGP